MVRVLALAAAAAAGLGAAPPKAEPKTGPMAVRQAKKPGHWKWLRRIVSSEPDFALWLSSRGIPPPADGTTQAEVHPAKVDASTAQAASPKPVRGEAGSQ